MIPWTRINLKSEKGNAMIMALSIIFILMAFGTVSLMSSLANMHMGANYKDWSKAYYTLDRSAEIRVNDLNTQLETAESNAQSYMAKHCYSVRPTLTGINSIDPELRVEVDAQSYIYTEWQNSMLPLTEDTVKEKFMEDTLKRLYYYYASNLIKDKLTDDVYSTTYLKNNTENIDLFNYQKALFTNEVGLEELNLNEKITINPTDPTFKGKTVAVMVDVQFPKYEMIKQSKEVAFKGNPIWTNAITAAGSIGFEGKGISLIKGDLFAADKDEFPGETIHFFNERNKTILLNDNNVLASGVYSDGGADAEIYGNVYSKGNLHIFGSNSKINVYLYPNDYKIANTILKNYVFSSNDPDNNPNNNLFFDYFTMKNIVKDKVKPDEYLMTTSSDNFIQGPLCTTSLPLVYEDVNGGNVYCNSLSVDDVVEGTIKVDGNVTTFNDITMNGLQSEITVAGNYIGINSKAINGDPNASSTVINNTALPPQTGTLIGSTITLNGKFVVPGTAYAEYSGVKKNEMPKFIWPTHDPNDPWLNKQYYQTGESITAKNADIYSAYMVALENPLTEYRYSMEPFTNDPETQPYNETKIKPFYLMRGDTEGTTDDNPIPKISQLADYLRRKPVVSNVFSGLSEDEVNGYSLGEALFHIAGAKTATVFGAYSSNPIDPNAGNYSAYSTFKSSLYNTFVSKTWNLGTADKLATSFKDVFVDSDVLLDGGGELRPEIATVPSNTPAFVFIKPTVSNISTLDLGNASDVYRGIIYCEGNLTITGNGSFNGSIICEGNVTITGNPTITYDEEVIKSVLVADGTARLFFAKVKMGKEIKDTTTEYDGAVRTDVKRYQIVEWKEEQRQP